MTSGQKENPYVSSTLKLDILHQSKNYCCKGKRWRSLCGLGRCFPSESLLHNTQAEPHWVSLAQAKIKPCSNLSIRGEKWRLCASDARIIKLTFVNSVVLLVYRQPPPKGLGSVTKFGGTQGQDSRIKKVVGCTLAWDIWRLLFN